VKFLEFHTVKLVIALLRRVHINPAYLLLPIALSLAAAFFEGIGLGLLVPLLNGFLTRDYSFITTTPVLSTILHWLPSSITSTDRALFGFLVAAFFIATILKNVLRYISTVSMLYVSTRTEHHLRKYLFEAYLHMEQEYFDRTSVGQHSTVLLQFSKQAVLPLPLSAKFVQALFPLIAYFIVMLTISWQVTLMTIPVFLVLHGVTRSLITRIQVLSAFIAKQTRLAANRAKDVLLQSTTVGPHREDWMLLVEGHHLGEIGSRRQQRVAMLALLFLQASYLELRTGERPIVLLDDVCSELDDQHQERILEGLSGNQVILTGVQVPEGFTGEVKEMVKNTADVPQAQASGMMMEHHAR
jgi:ABC-type multidrug transport system fused ATPase/permease subunit